MSSARPAATAALSPRAWGALLVLCSALFLDALDVSMVGVALPSIGSDLDLTTGQLQWIVSAYVLGYGGFLLLGGRAADLLGRRRMFLISLAVFALASGLGAFVDDGTLLIVLRFIKGVSAAFTAPAGLSIITTTFAEGPARNRAISIYNATGATGFSLGLVIGGVLTEIGWRWVFFVPAPVALLTLIAAYKLVPDAGRVKGPHRSFDLAGATAITGAMLLAVYTVVQAPEVGWASARTIGSLIGVAALIAGFVTLERRTAHPLVRLGIFRSIPLVRANIGAMALFGGWVGVQFIATLYMQEVRGWSPLETGLAIFPGGLVVATVAPRLGPLISRFGANRLITVGLLSTVAAYLLFLPIGADSSYLTAILPSLRHRGADRGGGDGAAGQVAPGSRGREGGLTDTCPGHPATAGWRGRSGRWPPSCP